MNQFMEAAKNDPPAGVLLVDKPVGPTSFDVIAKLRSVLRTRAIGHAGTLDPLASGVLVVLVGNYTRLSQYLTAANKGYRAEVTFGTSTSTDDREGEVIERGDAQQVSRELVERSLRDMLGEQLQVPPAYSAISVGGERLYQKARRGEAVTAPARLVTFSALTLEAFRDAVATIDVRCSKGTYIRALARDLGQAVGVPAHLSALRRESSGEYALDGCAELSWLLEADHARQALRRGPAAVKGMAALSIDEASARELELGRRIPSGGGVLDGTHLVACVGEQLVAIVRAVDDQFQVVRGLGRC